MELVISDTAYRLEQIEDWSTVETSAPVRVTNGTTQINGIAMAVTGTSLEVEALDEALIKADGWVLEAPSAIPPLPTEDRSVIRVWFAGYSDPAIAELRGTWEFLTGIQGLDIAETIPPVTKWEWLKKPQKVIAAETRAAVMNVVLAELEKDPAAEHANNAAADRDDLRLAVVAAIAAQEEEA